MPDGVYFDQVSEAGVHRPHVAGIHGREDEGAYSIVLSGGYEDDTVSGLPLFNPFFSIVNYLVQICDALSNHILFCEDVRKTVPSQGFTQA